jgi:hypothetical protein
MGMLAPLMLGMAARGSGYRYGATVAAGVYTLVIIGCVLILPLFPAEPKLGPVFQHVTQFIPPQFPVLLIAPALALDWLWSRFSAKGAAARRHTGEELAGSLGSALDTATVLREVRNKSRNVWLLAAISALLFLAVLVAFEWPFAQFLQTPAARNRFFGTMYYTYGTPSISYLVRNRFWDGESRGDFALGMGYALLAAFFSFAIGLSRGKWLREIQR